MTATEKRAWKVLRVSFDWLEHVPAEIMIIIINFVYTLTVV